MPDSGTMNVREAEAQLAKFKEDFLKIREEVQSDGEIDKEEAKILKDVAAIIAGAEAQLAEKKTGSGGEGTTETDDGDAGREAFEARKSDYRQLIVSADTLQKDGNPNAPTLTKFLNGIDDAVAEDRWGEAVELLDLAQMTVKSATGDTEGEETDPAAAKWVELAGDYDGVVKQIDEMRSDQHPDIERFEDFVPQMDRAVSEERWTDAIARLDLAQSALGAAGFKPEGAGEGPEADDALAELEEAKSEAEAEPSQGTAEATPSPETAEASDDDSEDEDEWLQMAGQLDEFQQLMQQLLQAGHDSASDMASFFSDILEARSESRWADAIMLLTNALASARALAREIGGDTPVANTTDPIVPGVTPDGPGGEEPVDPGRIAPTSASISGSVGKGGKNVAEDVQTVQQLLNQNGASPALGVDGAVGPKTNGAISKFQQEALGFQDGRVDPGGQTWGALTGGGSGAATGGGAGGATGGAADAAAAGGEAGSGAGGAAADRSRDPSGDKGGDTADPGSRVDPDLPTTPEDLERHLKKKVEEQTPAPTAIVIADDEDVLDPTEHRFLQNQEISVGCPFGTIAITFDDKGKVKSASVAAPIIQPVSVSVSAYAILGKLEAKPYSGALKLSRKGGNLQLELELSASGSGFMGIGLGKGDAWGGIGIEVEVKVARTDKVTAEMSLEMLKQIALGGAAAPIANATFSLPAEIVLSGSQSVVIGGSAPKGIISIASKMVFKDYNPMATLSINAAKGGLSCEFKTYDGLQQMAEDVARFQPQIDMLFRYYELVRDIQRMRDDPEGFLEDYEKKIEHYRQFLKSYTDDFGELVDEELAKLDALVLVFRALADKAEELYDDAEEAYDEAEKYLEKKAEELHDGAKELYGDAEKAYDDAEKYLEDKAEELYDGAKELYDDAEEAYDEAEEYLEKKAEEAEEYVDEKIDDAEEAYDDAKDAVEEKAEELWGDAVDLFSDDDDKD